MSTTPESAWLETSVVSDIPVTCGAVHAQRFADADFTQVDEPLDEPFGHALTASDEEAVTPAAGVVGETSPPAVARPTLRAPLEPHQRPRCRRTCRAVRDRRHRGLAERPALRAPGRSGTPTWRNQRRCAAPRTRPESGGRGRYPPYCKIRFSGLPRDASRSRLRRHGLTRGVCDRCCPCGLDCGDADE